MEKLFFSVQIPIVDSRFRRGFMPQYRGRAELPECFVKSLSMKVRQESPHTLGIESPPLGDGGTVHTATASGKTVKGIESPPLGDGGTVHSKWMCL